MIALTRDPSGRRASTIGELSSMRRPTPLTMRSMTRSRCWSSGRPPAPVRACRNARRTPAVRVDQDVADGLVAKQWLQRTKPEDFVDDIAQNGRARHRQRHARFGDERRHQRADFRLDLLRSAVASFSRFSFVSSLRWTLPRTSSARRALSTGSTPEPSAGSDPGAGLSGGFVVTGVAWRFRRVPGTTLSREPAHPSPRAHAG